MLVVSATLPIESFYELLLAKLVPTNRTWVVPQIFLPCRATDDPVKRMPRLSPSIKATMPSNFFLSNVTWTGSFRLNDMVRAAPSWFLLAIKNNNKGAALRFGGCLLIDPVASLCVEAFGFGSCTVCEKMLHKSCFVKLTMPRLILPCTLELY